MVAPSMHGAQVLAGLMDAETLIASVVRASSNPISLAVATAEPIVPQVPWEWTDVLTLVPVPIREVTSYPAMTLSKNCFPVAPRSSATANAAGITWMAACPPPKRLPSSISKATPAVALERAAKTAMAEPGCPRRVAGPWPPVLAANRASSTFSERRLPASIAPMVSNTTDLAALTVEDPRSSRRVSQTKRERRSR